MDINEVLNTIKPCNKKKDYIFVSYSKKDKEVVYPIILRLQEEGCNLWIDKELQKRAGTDWQMGALTAINNPNCQKVLFMVSKNSLTSVPVFAELSWVRFSRKVQKNHSGNFLEIVPVNVDKEWSPYKKGIAQWIQKELLIRNSEEITEDDYDCLSSLICIDKRYYEYGPDKLQTKGEVATAIFDSILKPFGGSKISIVDINDINFVEIIRNNIPESVFLPILESDDEGTKPYIYISYSHKDSDKVIPVIERLKEDGYRFWDDGQIPAGAVWDELIVDKLEKCSILLCFISDNYASSAYCNDELTYAYYKGKKILPVFEKNTVLTPHFKMLMANIQGIYAPHMYDDDFFQKLYRAKGMNACKE